MSTAEPAAGRAAVMLARLDSRRFPGKALARLGDGTLIERCLDALEPAAGYAVILATTDRPLDDPLAELGARRGLRVFRGSCEDVAGRVAACLRRFRVEAFARVNADSPFPRRALIAEGFALLEQGGYDLVTNLLPRAFPYGVSLEVLRAAAFLRSEPVFTAAEREHITSHFYAHVEKFRVYCYTYPHGNDSDVRLVVDTPEDLQALERLLAAVPRPESYPLDELARAYRRVVTARA